MAAVSSIHPIAAKEERPPVSRDKGRAASLFARASTLAQADMLLKGTGQYVKWQSLLADWQEEMKYPLNVIPALRIDLFGGKSFTEVMKQSWVRIMKGLKAVQASPQPMKFWKTRPLTFRH